MKKRRKSKEHQQFNLEWGCAERSLEYNDYDLHDLWYASVNKHDWFSMDIEEEYYARTHRSNYIK